MGRDDELAWLRGAWRGARRGRGRGVFVSGPTGIGKTSLVAALAVHVAGEGYSVGYAGSGGAAMAQLADTLAATGSAHIPMLAVLDDIGVIGDSAVEALAGAREAIESAPALVVCLLDDPDAYAPRWLAQLGIALVRPFGSIDEWIVRCPWEAIREAMQDTLTDLSWTELCFGTSFLAAGTQRLSGPLGFARLGWGCRPQEQWVWKA